MALTGDEIISAESLKAVLDEIRTGVVRLEARRLAGGELHRRAGRLRRS